jgi:hexosaminidase
MSDESAITLCPHPRHLRRLSGTFQGTEPVENITFDDSIPHAQGYRITITPTQWTTVARTPAGAFNAGMTIAQLLEQFGLAIPCLEIEDWPDFPIMLDISRDKVPTMQTLFHLIDLLASWKINQLQLYTEHTFAYSAHRTVWENASPITADEIRQLDAYCKERFIDLVPNQNSFGHMERWLKHPQYQHLAEAIDGAETPWGFRWKGPFSLCPTDPETLKFLSGLYTELLPNFSSPFFNVGCDETFDIGQGRSKADCDRIGIHRVYLNFIREVHHLVQANQKQMMFWGDVILHQPDLIAELPKNVIALQWGYEASHPFDKEGAAFANANIPYYVCPGTSSWNSIAGRTDNAIANLKSGAECGLRHGAIGYLITDWGDNGHLQYQPISYLGFMTGAACSWCLETNQDLDLPRALSLHAFKDPKEELGQIAYDLGNIYTLCGKPNANGSALFRLMVLPPNDPNPEKGMTPEAFSAAESALDRIKIPTYPDGELKLIADEFENAIRMLRQCIAIGREKLGFPASKPIDTAAIIAEHQRLWLARNRPGGLEDSVARIRS